MSGGESELGNKWRLKIKVGEKRREDEEEEGILKKKVKEGRQMKVKRWKTRD